MMADTEKINAKWTAILFGHDLNIFMAGAKSQWLVVMLERRGALHRIASLSGK
jgi:hypothetical protein